VELHLHSPLRFHRVVLDSGMDTSNGVLLRQSDKFTLYLYLTRQQSRNYGTRYL